MAASDEALHMIVQRAFPAAARQVVPDRDPQSAGPWCPPDTGHGYAFVAITMSW
jgi:hypothetical protein